MMRGSSLASGGGGVSRYLVVGGQTALAYWLTHNYRRADASIWDAALSHWAMGLGLASYRLRGRLVSHGCRHAVFRGAAL